MRDRPDILHVDLDAFYASVEQLDDPALRGKAVIVGGTGNRGVVCAASYEARRFGVHSAMPTARARRACPHAVFLPPRFERYSELSGEVMGILRAVTPLVEQLSIDEAFVDAGGVRRRWGAGPEVATMLRTRIRAETGLTASVGAASTKFLAKLASDMAKPDGLLVVPAGRELAFLDPLPVTRLWGVGPATFRTLDRMAIRTIGDVARVSEPVLVAALGDSLGRHLHALARNEDDRDVVPEHETKSIGAEETFGTDLHTRAECERELVRLADRATARVRASGLVARTVTLKVRFGDFETKTRARTLPERDRPDRARHRDRARAARRVRGRARHPVARRVALAARVRRRGAAVVRADARRDVDRVRARRSASRAREGDRRGPGALR